MCWVNVGNRGNKVLESRENRGNRRFDTLTKEHRFFMYNGEHYKHILLEKSYGNKLLKWAGKHFTPEQKQNYGAPAENGYNMMNVLLEQVGEQFTKIKGRPIDKVIYLEDVILLEGIGTYEYHPFSALAFLSLLYAIMLADDNHKPHHNIKDKAANLMQFMDGNWPKEAEEVRNIILYGDTVAPKNAPDLVTLIEQAECSLYPQAQEALMEHFGKTRDVHVHVHGDVNIDKNFGSITDNHDGGIIYE